MSKKIEVAIVGDASNYIRQLKTAEGSTSTFGGTLGKLKVAAAGAALGGVAVLGEFLVSSVHAAEGAEVAHSRLVEAFKAVGLSADAHAKQIDAAESSMRKLGFTDTQTETALGSLVTATGSAKTAMQDLGVAADLARFKHVDLETATKNLTAAMGGSQRAIKQLGIAVAPVTTAVDALKRSDMDLTTEAGRAALAHAKLVDKMATGQEVIAKTSALVEGQGEAYAKTAAGGMAQFSAQLDHLQVALGENVLPVLGSVATSLANFLDNINKLLEPLHSLKHAIDQNAFASKALGVVWDYLLGPMAAVNRSVALLKAAVDAGKIAFNGLKIAASAVSTFFEGAFTTSVNATKTLISSATTNVKALDTAFDGVKGAAKAVASFFEGGLTKTFHEIKGTINAVKSVIDTLAAALRAVESAARAVASALSSIHVPSIHLPNIHLPHIPGTATGGIVTGPQLRLVGEAGPEAIIPLSRGFKGGGGGGDIHFHGGTFIGATKEELGKAVALHVRDELKRHENRNGRIF